MENQSLNHIAIIMDGNGRWAKKRGLLRSAGHKAGAENIRNIAIEANKRNIKQLTLYAFSTENWNRPEDEISYLMRLPKFFFDAYLKELIKNNVKVSCIGEIDVLPEDAKKILYTAMEKTKDNTGLQLCFALNYGSRREIYLAATKFAEAYQADPTILEEGEAGFSKFLMTNGMPEIDLLIRTSGEQRLSNYLLWQLAYTEFIFTDVSWPDFNGAELDRCIEQFKARNRRFGGV